MPPSSATTVENLPLGQRVPLHVNETRRILLTLSCREIVYARTASASPD